MKNYRNENKIPKKAHTEWREKEMENTRIICECKWLFARFSFSIFAHSFVFVIERKKNAMKTNERKRLKDWNAKYFTHAIIIWLLHDHTTKVLHYNISSIESILRDEITIASLLLFFSLFLFFFSSYCKRSCFYSMPFWTKNPCNDRLHMFPTR